ncbi:MAG TPA: sensor histidine kinase [Ilumatobacteraceae bacterium]|nr:sensor histidine kinase [Ilumatobacteraceae bacterium]
MEVSGRSRWRWPAVDGLVLAFAALVLVLAAVSNDESGAVADPRSFDVVAALLLAVGVVVVVLGGRFPASAASVAMALTFLWYGVGYVSGLVNVVTIAAFYRLGTSAHAGRKAAVTGVSVVASLLVIAGFSGESWWEALTAAGYVVMAVLFGELIRSRRLLVEHHAEEAAQLQRDAQRRIAEERLQIARDVHDLLAHTISSMTVQAGVATDAVDRDDEAVREALANIRHAGRTAMQEMRATVSFLRSADGGSGMTPAPRLERISELVELTREHGIDVDFVLEPPDRAMPELVELTAYRIVQESLTNVVRHANASRADVSVTGDAAVLTVEVRDDGDVGEPPTPGFGLRGMAERVELVGGQLWHGVGDDGGWTVCARIPLQGSRT